MKVLYGVLSITFLIIIFILFSLFSHTPQYGTSLFSNTFIDVILTMIKVIAGVFALTIMIGSIQKYRTSHFGNILLFFAAGTASLTIGELFLMLNALTTSSLDHDAIDDVWHIIFYISTIAFLIGVWQLYKMVRGEVKSLPLNTTYLICGGVILLSAIILVVVQLTNNAFIPLLEQSRITNLGAQHFLAFFLAGSIAFFLWRINQKALGSKLIIRSFLVAFIFLSLTHLWELITETWTIIPISEEIGRHIQALISLPAYMFFVQAFLNDTSYEERVERKEVSQIKQ